MRPKAPGLYISKWREEGPVLLETAEEWRDEHGWNDWMAIIEAALYLDAAELVELILPVLTPAQRATFDLVRRRMLGDHRLEEAIDQALEVCRNPETRDLALEGRLRMERGLQRFEKGDATGAEEDLTWAETRLKSVAKASRDHDLSLLNKAAYHMASGKISWRCKSMGIFPGRKIMRMKPSRYLELVHLAFTHDMGRCSMLLEMLGTDTHMPFSPIK